MSFWKKLVWWEEQILKMAIGKPCSGGTWGPRCLYNIISCSHGTDLWGSCCFFQMRAWVPERPSRGHVACSRSWELRPPHPWCAVCGWFSMASAQMARGGTCGIHTGSVQKVPASRSQVQLHPRRGLRLSIPNRRWGVGAASRSPL